MACTTYTDSVDYELMILTNETVSLDFRWRAWLECRVSRWYDNMIQVGMSFSFLQSLPEYLNGDYSIWPQWLICNWKKILHESVIAIGWTIKCLTYISRQTPLYPAHSLKPIHINYQWILSYHLERTYPVAWINLRYLLQHRGTFASNPALETSGYRRWARELWGLV
jgi:hypothetical protein